MQASDFRGFINLLKEVEEEERRIRRLQRELEKLQPKAQTVTDVVTCGKRGKKPLATRTITGRLDYSGINRKSAQLRIRMANKQLRLAEIQTRLAEVEEYIYRIPDPVARRVMELYCLDYIDRPRTWEEVAREMGDGYTADQCRKMVKRWIGRAQT